MAKDEEMMMASKGKGMMLVLAALLIAVGMLGSAYMLSRADFAPTVNITSGPTNPNVYVSSTPPDHAISVSATASKKVAPDQLNILLRVQTQSTSAKQAQQDNAQVSADLRSKLQALGVADQNIQTVSYDVQPAYDSQYICDKGGMNCHYNSVITGYTSTQTLNVELDDLTKGGDVIDAASTAGNNQTFVDSVQFTLKDDTQRSVEKDLLQQASADAKTKADSIATGAGVSTGKLLSVSESFNYPIPYYRSYDMMAGSVAAPSVPTQLNPGQVAVSATVSASFDING